MGRREPPQISGTQAGPGPPGARGHSRSRPPGHSYLERQREGWPPRVWRSHDQSAEPSAVLLQLQGEGRCVPGVSLRGGRSLPPLPGTVHRSLKQGPRPKHTCPPLSPLPSPAPPDLSGHHLGAPGSSPPSRSQAPPLPREHANAPTTPGPTWRPVLGPWLSGCKLGFCLSTIGPRAPTGHGPSRSPLRSHRLCSAPSSHFLARTPPPRDSNS